MILSTRRDGLHSLTYTHYDRAEAGMRRIPRHRHAKQLHERPNYQVHTCWQCIGGSDSRPTWRQQANLERSSKQPLTSCGRLPRASCVRHPLAPLFTIATSLGHVFAHARSPRSDRDPRSSRKICLCLSDRQFDIRPSKKPLEFAFFPCFPVLSLCI